MAENAAMPENTSMPIFLTSCGTKSKYGNMTESEMICVRVATLLKQICKHTKTDVIRQYMSEL